MTVLDGLEDDEIELARAGIFNHFGVPLLRSFGDKRFLALDPMVQAQIKAYIHGYQADITRFFKGILRSTVTCLECNQQSSISDPFLDISVPIGASAKGKRSGLFGWSSRGTARKRLSKAERKRQKAARKAQKRELKKKRGKGHSRDPSVGSAASFGSVDSELSAIEANGGGAAAAAAAAAATTTVDGGDVEVIRLEDELGLPEPSPPAPPPSPTHGVPASPLLPREYKPKAGECSIESSLAALFREEKLAGEDCFACEACYAAGARGGDVVENLSATDDETGSECGYVMRDAKRHFAITKCPQILTIHLKRFEQHGMDLHKVSRHVSFEPVIDMSHFCDPSIPFVVGDDGREGVLYELYAVVQHHGRMQSGHYTAYIKDTTTPSKGPASARWFHISDDRYTECSLSQVLRAEAYQLFYERLEPPPAAGPATPATAAPPPVPESTTIRV